MWPIEDTGRKLFRSLISFTLALFLVFESTSVRAEECKTCENEQIDIFRLGQLGLELSDIEKINQQICIDARKHGDYSKDAGPAKYPTGYLVGYVCPGSLLMKLAAVDGDIGDTAKAIWDQIGKRFTDAQTYFSNTSLKQMAVNTVVKTASNLSFVGGLNARRDFVNSIKSIVAITPSILDEVFASPIYGSLENLIFGDPCLQPERNTQKRCAFIIDLLQYFVGGAETATAKEGKVLLTTAVKLGTTSKVGKALQMLAECVSAVKPTERLTKFKDFILTIRKDPETLNDVLQALGKVDSKEVNALKELVAALAKTAAESGTSQSEIIEKTTKLVATQLTDKLRLGQKTELLMAAEPEKVSILGDYSIIRESDSKWLVKSIKDGTPHYEEVPLENVMHLPSIQTENVPELLRNTTEQLAKVAVEAEAQGKKVQEASFFVFDLNGLKQINDWAFKTPSFPSGGHATGNAILSRVAEIVKNETPHGFIARTGGDEKGGNAVHKFIEAKNGVEGEVYGAKEWLERLNNLINNEAVLKRYTEEQIAHVDKLIDQTKAARILDEIPGASRTTVNQSLETVKKEKLAELNDLRIRFDKDRPSISMGVVSIDKGAFEEAKATGQDLTKLLSDEADNLMAKMKDAYKLANGLTRVRGGKINIELVDKPWVPPAVPDILKLKRH